MKILMNRQGHVFTVRGGKIIPVSTSSPLPNKYKEIVTQLVAEPGTHFYRMPYYKVAVVKDRYIVDAFELTPGDFSPGSPFDTLYAVQQYVNGTIVLPRMYLYPTARCNCNCPICQFQERHRRGLQLCSTEMRRTLAMYHAYRGDIQEQTLIVSGDGEPLLYPAINELLDDAFSNRMRVFLTSNLTIPNRSGLYEKLTQCSMITISIKGLTAVAYAKYQGLRDESKFNTVMCNLETLLKLREDTKRVSKCLIGIASLILPENSSVYNSFIDRAAAMGIDYLYLNQVEPSCEKHGIVFTDSEKAETLRQLQEYSIAPHKSMTVRVSSDPFRKRGGDTVYYDASVKRKNKDICGSALFNPLVLADINGKAKMLACRNSDLFDKPEFAYRLNNGQIDHTSIALVMEAARDCRHCRLERQVKHLDKMLTLAKKYREACEYLLVFNLEKLKEHAYSFINFETVIR